MEHIIKHSFNSNQSQYSDQVKRVLGGPTKIIFQKKAYEQFGNVVSILKTPIKSSIRSTRIAARTDTEKGTIYSWFLATSEIEGQVCNLDIQNNHSIANLNGQAVFFYSTNKEPEITESGEDQLTAAFYQFHHWICFEIVLHLSQTGYFSSLHNTAEIHSVVLIRPPLCL
ncbi:hypothetical protein ACIOYV_11945 [Pseudomonas sp. NPDC087342]|uniref:hypothetical protein n=1 Tax=Pseudomonas sp. NPDC087342 TaxID=3364437 RepID=UPI0038002D2C